MAEAVHWRRRHVGNTHPCSRRRDGGRLHLEQPECFCAGRLHDHVIIVQGWRAAADQDGWQQQAESELCWREPFTRPVLVESTGRNQELRSHHVRPRRSGWAGRRALGCLRHPSFGDRLRGGRDQPGGQKYVGGKSTMNLPHYFGPCTPAGAPHHYTFTLIATDLEPMTLQRGMDRDELMKALDGHAKGATGIIGTFSKP